MNKKILLIGGGGHCKSVLDTLIQKDEYYNISIIDKKENIGKKILGIEVIGSDEDIESLYKKGYKYAFITLGSIGNPKTRIKLFDIIKKTGFKIPNIIDYSATVSNNVNIERGIFIGKMAIINAGTTIRDGAIINTGAIIEHDCNIGKFVHIASGAVLGGNVNIKDNSHIGSNTTIINNIEIGSNTVIGIGSVVTKNIDNNVLSYGSPCRVISYNK